MIRGHNKNGLFIDVELLRDHIYKLREEKKIVERLYDSVMAMKSCSDSMYGQENVVLCEIDHLLEYFARMINVLENAETEAIQLSHIIGGKIEEDTEQARRISLRSFML